MTDPRKLSTDLGLTLAELAARVGVSRMTLNRWQRGVASPSPRHLERLRQLQVVQPIRRPNPVLWLTPRAAVSLLGAAQDKTLRDWRKAGLLQTRQDTQYQGQHQFLYSRVSIERMRDYLKGGGKAAAMRDKQAGRWQ